MAGTGSKTGMDKGSTAAAVAEATKPVSLPPTFDGQSAQAADVAPSAPIALTDAQLTALVGGAGAAAAPSLEPPALEVGGATVSIWVQNVKVAALWSINQNRNSWASFSGKGWQKFNDNSDSAIMAFTTLAAHARVAQGNTSYRSEADNKVHEIYVW